MALGPVEAKKLADKLRERPELYTETDIEKVMLLFREWGLIAVPEEEKNLDS